MLLTTLWRMEQVTSEQLSLHFGSDATIHDFSTMQEGQAL